MKKHRKKILSLFTTFILLSSMVFSTPFTVMAAEPLHPITWGSSVNGYTGNLTLNTGDILDLSGITAIDAGSGKTITANGGSVTI